MILTSSRYPRAARFAGTQEISIEADVRDVRQRFGEALALRRPISLPRYCGARLQRCAPALRPTPAGSGRVYHPELSTADLPQMIPRVDSVSDRVRRVKCTHPLRGRRETICNPNAERLSRGCALSDEHATTALDEVAPLTVIAKVTRVRQSRAKSLCH